MSEKRLVERLQDMVDWFGKIETEEPDPGVRVDDIREAIARLGPYEPGEEIEVSFYACFDKPHLKAKFVSAHWEPGGKVWAILLNQALPELFQFHRQTGETVTVNLPVNVVKIAKKQNWNLQEAEECIKAIAEGAKDGK